MSVSSTISNDYKKVKIVATLGPSTNNEESIKTMIDLGVNVFRLNFSYGTHEEHKKTIDAIRKLSGSKMVAIMQDICGPKIRIKGPKSPVTIMKNSIVKIYRNSESDRMSITYPDIINRLEIDDLIYIADGTIKLKVVSKSEDYVSAEALTGGIIKNGSGVNIPKGNLNIPAITKKDEDDLIFGARNGIDLVAVSFVEKAQDIQQARDILEKHSSDAWIIAKIERKAAIDNLNEIIETSDGVMVARGDLGAEIGLCKVPIIKRQIIEQANLRFKPVIVATQMLTSMIQSPTPTRAEVSDIANAVLTGADAVMLSDETAIGKYFKEAIDVLRSTIKESLSIYPFYKTFDTNQDEIISKCSVDIAKNTSTTSIISITDTGYTAKQIAKFRPKKPIVAITFSESIKRRLSIVWGINDCFVLEKSNNPEKFIFSLKQLNIKTPFVLTAGSVIGKQGTTNMVRIVYS